MLLLVPAILVDVPFVTHRVYTNSSTRYVLKASIVEVGLSSRSGTVRKNFAPERL